jgi:hypothetical protein
MANHKPLEVAPFRIELLESSLAQHTPGSNITGVAFFDFVGEARPDRSWSDFPVALASEWLFAVRSQLQKGRATFVFLDGPYRIDAFLDKHDHVRLRCIANQVEDSPVEGEYVIPRPTLASAVADFAKRVVNACDQRGYEYVGLTALKRDVFV